MTGPLTILELQNPSPYVPELHRIAPISCFWVSEIKKGPVELYYSYICHFNAHMLHDLNIFFDDAILILGLCSRYYQPENQCSLSPVLLWQSHPSSLIGFLGKARKAKKEEEKEEEGKVGATNCQNHFISQPPNHGAIGQRESTSNLLRWGMRNREAFSLWEAEKQRKKVSPHR